MDGRRHGFRSINTRCRADLRRPLLHPGTDEHGGDRGEREEDDRILVRRPHDRDQEDDGQGCAESKGKGGGLDAEDQDRDRHAGEGPEVGVLSAFERVCESAVGHVGSVQVLMGEAGEQREEDHSGRDCPEVGRYEVVFAPDGVVEQRIHAQVSHREGDGNHGDEDDLP